MKICSVENYGKRAPSTGLCKKHYQAAWYKRHAERLSAKGKIYAASHQEERRLRDAKNAERIREQRRANYYATVESKRIVAKAWRDANADKVKAQKRAYHLKRAEYIKARVTEWVRKNPDKRKANVARWMKAHPDQVNANLAKRRATQLNATPRWANEFFIREAYHLARLRTKVMGFKWQVDHIVPLRSKLVCGLHCEANIQVVPALHNRRKSNVTWPDMP